MAWWSLGRWFGDVEACIYCVVCPNIEYDRSDVNKLHIFTKLSAVCVLVLSGNYILGESEVPELTCKSPICTCCNPFIVRVYTNSITVRGARKEIDVAPVTSSGTSTRTKGR